MSHVEETVQMSFLSENEMIKARVTNFLAECKQKGKVNKIRL
jgi:predicted nucleic-acid-binding protein